MGIPSPVRNNAHVEGKAVAGSLCNLCRQLGITPLSIGLATAVVATLAVVVVADDITEEWWGSLQLLWFWVLGLQVCFVGPCLVFHHSSYWRGRAGWRRNTLTSRGYAFGLARFLGVVSFGAVGVRMLMLWVINACAWGTLMVPLYSLVVEVVLNAGIWVAMWTVLMKTRMIAVVSGTGLLLYFGLKAFGGGAEGLGKYAEAGIGAALTCLAIGGYVLACKTLRLGQVGGD